MRQSQCQELIKDYEHEIKYHLSKTNVVIDALNRKVILPQITTHQELQQKLVRE